MSQRMFTRAAALCLTTVVGAGLVVGAPQASATGDDATGKTSAPSADAQKGQRSINAKVKVAAKIAKKQLGDPYVYGATGPNSFDCSGFTGYAYAHAGLRLPRTSSQQAAAVRRISRSNLQRGDLIFFHSGGSVYHVAMYWGRKGGQRIILHSPNTGSNVRFDNIWTNSWFAGTRRTKKAPVMSGASGSDSGSSGTLMGGASGSVSR